MAVAAGALVALPSCSREESPKADKQMIVLGFDGLDPKLCKELLDAGRLPNFAKLAAKGGFMPLQTSTPPQSPVAWSSIITGTNPGEHGIFDFIHRDPKTYFPDFSTSRNEPAGWPLRFGRWEIPLASGKVINLRHGDPFWSFLTRHGVNASVYRIPANYPPQQPEGPGEFRTLTDMGTPDLLGEVGKCFFYTSGPFEGERNFGGGEVHRLQIRPIGGDAARSTFFGPPDPFLNVSVVGQAKAHKPLEVDFTLIRDRETRTAMVEWQGHRVVLSEGAWSDWQNIDFKMGPVVGGATASGVFRMYLRQVLPTIEMYVTPIQIDPRNPALPVSVPADFSEKVADAIGPYFTQGLPEDTQGLRYNVLTRDEFLEQAELIYQERLKLLNYALDHYDKGFMFFYFGSTDQIGHMFWSAMADEHPALTDAEAEKYKNVMRDLYARVDQVVGKVMDRYPDATLLCISDHGFANFARGFNLNTWLVQNGYAVLNPKVSDHSTFACLDFTKTRAYGMGINGLYINLAGRERDGIVKPEDKQALMDELCAKLAKVVDPETGQHPVQVVYQAEKVYSGAQIAHGPDMQVGYSLGYRGSWSTALGGVSDDLIEANTEAWCGDHCIATNLVPGVIFSSEPIKLDTPTLEDLAPTILHYYGISQPPVMKGGDVFEAGSRPKAPAEN
ncbi:MAG TPA: alkaline phosphatase family protein [Phycisphaerae bacterium]|nr:alkaline phosphatase family protein [Phycisphaerales bacterium]HRX83632.1 alkaline phosphatase family protein [Phycisphaerae bacterium]